jgi:hypothetical protein
VLLHAVALTSQDGLQGSTKQCSNDQGQHKTV